LETKKWFGLTAVVAAVTGLAARLLGRKRASQEAEPVEEAIGEDLEVAETE
jgi:hypothetical protein